MAEYMICERGHELQDVHGHSQLCSVQFSKIYWATVTNETQSMDYEENWDERD